MHRQLRRDLRVGELVKQLQHRSALAFGKTLAGVAAVVVVRARPDVLEPFLARHRLHRPRLAVDDGRAHAAWRGAIREVAVAVEVALMAVNRQRKEDAGDAAGEEFTQREHVVPHPQRRQDVEHVVVFDLGDLEPFARIECGRVVFRTVRPLCMAIEHAEHLPTVGNALIDLSDRRGDHGGGSFQPRRAEARLTPSVRHPLQPF